MQLKRHVEYFVIDNLFDAKEFEFLSGKEWYAPKET